MTDSRARLIGLLGATAAAALTLASLLPTKWVPRTGLGWEDEHFIVYFATTMILSLASRRPYAVAIMLMICAGVLEAAQGLTPDRVPALIAALSGAVGVTSAATLALLLIRSRRWLMARSHFVSISSSNAHFPTQPNARRLMCTASEEVSRLAGGRPAPVR